MIKYIIKRIIFAVFALFILLTIIFFLMSLLPISPMPKDPKQTEEQYKQALEAAGLTKPLLERYGDYWVNLFHGNLGLIYNRPSTTIQQEIFPRIPNTLYIASIAYILSILLGFTFGFIAAIYHGKWQDTLVNIVSVIFISVPSFVVGIILLKFASVIGLPLKFSNFGDVNWNVGKFIASSIMPILALTFGLASTLTYYVRNEVIEVLNQDYIKTAKSKGLGTIQIIFCHVLRNAIIPALSIMGPSLLYIISGSIVLEQMFGVAGIANVLVNAIQTNQVNLVMFQALFLSGIYFLITIILDVVYTIIDPRIKIAQHNDLSIFNILKATQLRFIWRQKWILLKTNNVAYETITFNSSLHRFLIDNNLIDFKKKIIYIENWIYEKFDIDKNIKYFILGKDVFLKKGGDIHVK